MKLSKKLIFLLIFLAVIVVAIFWLDILGSEPVPVMVVAFGTYAFMFILKLNADGYFSYYSEKVAFLDEDPKEKKDNAKSYKPLNNPIPRYYQIHKEPADHPKVKHWVWTYNGYNRGFQTKPGNKLFFGPKSMVHMAGNTLIFLGRKRRISHKAFFEYIGRDKQIYDQAVLGQYMKIYVPEPLKSEEYDNMKSVINGHDFKDDKFNEVIYWLVDMIPLKNKSLDNLKKAINSKIEFSEDVTGGMKRTAFNIDTTLGYKRTEFKRSENYDDDNKEDI
jgi:hypothetical protein